jgi:phage-related protein (TIGR01555 family)
MTRKRANSTAAAKPAESAGRWRAEDSFANFAARVGVGTDNQSSNSTYQFDFISRNRIKLEAMYRSSWVVGQAVDVVAEDMTRAGIEITGDEVDPDDKERMYKALQRLGIWDKLADTIKWGRLYGGALGVLLIDGQNMATPLRPETVGKGQFKGIYVLDRWMCQPSLTEQVSDFGPHFGEPLNYTVMTSQTPLDGKVIHYSRVVRIDGVDLPYQQRFSEQGWGQSVIERLYDRLVAFDSTTMGVAQLVYKAHLRTLKVKGLREILASGGPAERALLRNVDFIRRFQSNEGLTLIDAEDDFGTHQFTFSGLDNVLLQFGQQLSGALQIPLVRLFGQSPAGLNATGESDLAMYHDNIKQQQERRLRSPFDVILDLTWRSELGSEPPEDLAHEFRSLEQMSDTEKATVASTVADAVTKAYDLQAIDRATAMKELRGSSHATGIFSNITDEMIAEAENDPPPVLDMPNAEETNNGPGAETQPEPGSDQNAAG